MENYPLTYQEAKNRLAELQAQGKTEQARDLEIWIDNELDKAYEYQAAMIDAMNEGSERHA